MRLWGKPKNKRKNKQKNSSYLIKIEALKVYTLNKTPVSIT